MPPRLARLLFWAVVVSSSLAAEEFDIARAINQTGINLFSELTKQRPGQNLVISPYSIQSALALAYTGADGTTRAEMAAALHFPAGDIALASSLGSLRSALDGATESAAKRAKERRHVGGRVDDIAWHEANRLFGQHGYDFRDSFLTLMRDRFAAPFEAFDFVRGTDKARLSINGWVADQTREKIRDLIPPNGVNSTTRLVLVNALYLKAPWHLPFEKELTSPRPFHFATGLAHDVPTMNRTITMGYTHEADLTVVSLDYLGGELTCLILLPDQGHALDSLANLTPNDFSRWGKLGRVGPTASEISLFLPKFRVEVGTLALGAALRRLGVRSAFDEPPGSANFDRIAPRKPNDYLAISEVFHKTFVAFDEDGTEAAAATAVGVVTFGIEAKPKKPIEVRVDRPFLFAIQHRASGTCLFLGRITDPR